MKGLAALLCALLPLASCAPPAEIPVNHRTDRYGHPCVSQETIDELRKKDQLWNKPLVPCEEGG